MTKIAFGDLWRLVYDILETADDDYCALYETYWSLPPGDFEEKFLGGKKKYSLSTLMNLNYLLYNEKYVNIVSNINGEYCESKDQNILFIPKNYIPFSRIDGMGFFLITLEKGSMLKRKIYNVKREYILSQGDID